MVPGKRNTTPLDGGGGGDTRGRLPQGTQGSTLARPRKGSRVGTQTPGPGQEDRR